MKWGKMHRRSNTRTNMQFEFLLPLVSSEEPSSTGTPGRIKSHEAGDFLEMKAITDIEKDIFHKYAILARGGADWGRRIWAGLAAALIIICLLIFVRHDSRSRKDAPDFVTVSGTRFYKDCRPFYLSGFNTHDAVTAALLTASEYKVAGGKSGKDQVREMFSQASQAGLTVVRTWVHTDDPQFPFQVGPGEYNEVAFRALDFVIEEARRNGLKILLSLVDNWKYYNGVDQFVDWSETAPERTQDRFRDRWGDPSPMTDLDPRKKMYEVARHALFYNDTGSRQLYKNHVYSLVHRKNTFNGYVYREDPTIFAWDLLNEPRCETWRVPECDHNLQAWIEEMAAYVKSIDPNHLVTIGSEGFFKQGSLQQSLNPQDWSGQMGQDFVLNHLPKEVDFATIHVWPDNWERTEEEFGRNWITSHIETAAKGLGKPLLVEEFGKKLPPLHHNPQSIRVMRDSAFKSVYGTIETAIAEGTAIGGSLFWRWTLPMFHGNGRDEYGVDTQDSTFDIIKQHSNFVSAWINSQPSNPKCKMGCWVSHTGWISRRCENLPEVCTAYWDLVRNTDNATWTARELQGATVMVHNKLISLEGLQVYPTRDGCCRAGQGAFSNGCSWTSWVA